jgi:hypothetical protein
MRRTVAAMAAAVAAAAFPCAAAAQAPAAPEPSAAVLAKYAAALQAVEAPKFVRFEYSVEQVGQRNIVQTHRVYRSGTRERDEILSVDGQSLPNPSVRIVSHRVDRYGIAAVAPQVKDYVFTFAGARRTAGHVEYSFSTAPRAAEAPAFGVTGVVIDDRRYLPSGVLFSMAAHGLKAGGRLTYAPQDRYWMIAEATVTARSAAGTVSRERIAWSRYAFPSALPDATFVAPRPLPTSTP